MTRLALFASGSGTNAENIIRHFRNSPHVMVQAVYCNKPDAGVLRRAADLGIATRVFTRTEFYESGQIVKELKAAAVDWIVLAGFLWLVPQSMIDAYPHRIVNIHPALLPGLGGKGMYGTRVHEAVIASGAKESGITIHYVDEKFDEGEIILRASCPVLPGDTSDTLAARVHALEYKHYPVVIEKLLTGAGL